MPISHDPCQSQAHPVTFAVCAIGSAIVAFAFEYPALTPAAQRALFILLFAASLWVTGAIAPFAVSLLIIGLSIALLGRPGGVFAQGNTDWEIFVRPWASPLIWLFLGGFVLAAAAARTALDRWFAQRAFGWIGASPDRLLLGTIGITFTFSMFMSNTATTAMMLAVMKPVLEGLPPGAAFRRGLMLAIPFGANLGGMGTIIGSPPNAIAAGNLQSVITLNFADWMVAGVPPALITVGFLWLYLRHRYPAASAKLELPSGEQESTTGRAGWRKLFVMAVFFVTVALWLSEPLHGMPVAVVSFLPIVLFSASGILGESDIRALPWDVLLLIAGGLTLGVTLTETGLADWIVQQLPLGVMSPIFIVSTLAALSVMLSNVMSNTAAANVLIPIALATGAAAPAFLVVPIALAASAAMCLPISTPPNAMAFASGHLRTRDFLEGGLIFGLVGTSLAVMWCWAIFGRG